MLIVQQVNDAWSPLPARYDFRAGAKESEETQRRRLLHNVHRVARDEQLGDLSAECFRHLFAADVGDALQSQIHVDRVAGSQIILDALDDEPDKVAVRVHQHRDE